MRLPTFALALAAFAVVGCGDDDPQSPDDSPQTIQLSAAQATAIRTRIVQLAPVDPSLAWLADSIGMVVAGGVEVEQVPVTTTTGTGPFYAVSLQRTIRTSSTASAAFDVIMFNDPSNPTDFIVVSGWTNPGINGNPPTSVSGTFGSPTATSTVNAHFFHSEGSSVSMWSATAGTATFTTGASSGSCPAVPNTSSVTCQQATLNAQFNVTIAMPTVPLTISSTRAASMAATDVDGIIIKMTITQ